MVVQEVRFFYDEQWYTRTSFDHYVFIKKYSSDDFSLSFYYLIFGQDASKIEKLKMEFNNFLFFIFPMKDLCPTK